MTAYDHLAEYYRKRRADTSRFDYNRDIEVPGMLSAIGSVRGRRVLDEGCGFGDHLARLAKDDPEELVGIDISGTLVSYARRQHIPNCRFSIHDLNKALPFPDGYFDIVMSSLTVFYIQGLWQLFAENHRMLKPGGTFVFSIFHPVLMLMNTSGKGIVGTRRDSQGKQKIYGDYFNEGPQEADMGGLGKVTVYPHTLQTYFSTLQGCGFTIMSYSDLLPVPESQKYDPQKFKLTSTLPTFSVIVAQK